MILRGSSFFAGKQKNDFSVDPRGLFNVFLYSQLLTTDSVAARWRAVREFKPNKNCSGKIYYDRDHNADC